MKDERTDERDLPPADGPTPPSPPTDGPRPSTFETDWDEAPTTNTFRIPRS